MDDNVEQLIEKLPFFINNYLSFHSSKDQLIEIILDLGRRPEARFQTGPKYLSQKIISWQDLEYTIKRIGTFNLENRTGIDRTLHRISCIRNRQFLINGLTCRVGRSIFGTISVIRDLLELNKSILILGKPGIGKTTIIREIARILANEMEKRVIVIDTSNEIAGESDVPHLTIGYARRMQGSKTKLQHQVMLEAVENHTPQVIIIDEISTELEVLASRTIGEKGVQLIGTTHGHSLNNLIKNPVLVDLMGGVEYVTLSDDEAKRRKTKKSILERKTFPTFDIIIEMNESHFWTIHEDTKTSIDFLLRDRSFIKQIRYFSNIGKIQIKSRSINSISNSFWQKKYWFRLNKPQQNRLMELKSKILIIYPYSLSTNLLKEILLKMKVKFILTKEIKKASMIIGVKKHILKNINITKSANKFNIPIYSLKHLNYYQLKKLFTKFA